MPQSQAPLRRRVRPEERLRLLDTSASLTSYVAAANAPPKYALICRKGLDRGYIFTS